jgi:osmoprotectant transport system permease protein
VTATEAPADVVGGPSAPAAVDTKSATPDASAPRGLGLLVGTPIFLLTVSVLLYLYVSGADKDSAETSALDWGTKLWPQLTTHISLSLWSTLFVLLIAVPLGVVLTRPTFRRDVGEVGRRSLPWPVRPALERVSPGVLTVANIGQALPAYGLFILFYAWQGPGFRTSVIALTVFALLPVLRNTMVGIEQVDPAIIEAGRGMGMSRLRVLLRIELPLSVPIILAGVRTALVINVGMAALAFLVGGGGLGITINSGLKLRRDLITVTGAGMVAILALTIDWIAAVVERVLRPKGL